jgi:hypothetical protein
MPHVQNESACRSSDEPITMALVIRERTLDEALDPVPVLQTVRGYVVCVLRRCACDERSEELVKLISPRFGGRSDYAAIAATCAFNSNSIGLT